MQGAFVFKQSIRWDPSVGKTDRYGPHYVVVAKHVDHGIYFAKLFEGDSLAKVTIAIARRLFGKEKKPTRQVKVQDTEGNPLVGAKVYLCGSRLAKPDSEKTDRKYHTMRLMHDIGVASAVSNDEGIAEVLMAPSANYWVVKEGLGPGIQGGVVHGCKPIRNRYLSGWQTRCGGGRSLRLPW